MTEFTLYTETNAPEESRAMLEDSLKGFGMIPNLHAVMSESPGLLKAYKSIHELFMNSDFNKEELTVIWQTINVENACHYCVPAHTAIAKSMGVSDEISEALRNETQLPDNRLEALRSFTLSILRNRGNVDEGEVDAFLAAGYTRRHILEVILGVSQKTMSNYTNHLANTPIDDPFQPFAWEKK